jgi:hypothetical protein
MAARNSRVPTDVEARRGVNAKCDLGEMRIRVVLEGERVRAAA